jgi:hypothetical protein
VETLDRQALAAAFYCPYAVGFSNLNVSTLFDNVAMFLGDRMRFDLLIAHLLVPGVPQQITPKS